MRESHFKVITQQGQIVRVQIWNPDQPLLLGDTSRWALENTPTGPLIRLLDPNPSRDQKPSFYYLENQSKNTAIHVDLEPNLKISLKRLSSASHLFQLGASLLFQQTTPKRPLEETFFGRLSVGTLAILALFALFSPEAQKQTSVVIEKEVAPTVKYFVKRPVAQTPAPVVVAAPPPAWNPTRPTKKTQPKARTQAPASLAQLFSSALTLTKNPSRPTQNKSLQQSNLFKTEAQSISKEADLNLSQKNSGKPSTRQISSVEGLENYKGIKGKLSGDIIDNTAMPSMSEKGLLADEVGQIIHKHMDSIRYCHEAAIIAQPNISGRVVVRFVIGGSGSVKKVSITSSTLPSDQLSNCIMRKLSTFRFPKPKGGIDVSVDYPFIFKMLGQG